jgi:23S rRNA A1618 N6-methylase RlmF
MYDRFDFVMCNPPFYESVDDMKLSLESKEDDPSAVCIQEKK